MKLFILFILISFPFIGSTVFAQSAPKTVITCTGTTVKNQPCKQIVKAKGDKCRFHADNKVVCGSNTTKNKPCQIVVTKQGDKCWRHKS